MSHFPMSDTPQPSTRMKDLDLKSQNIRIIDKCFILNDPDT